MPLVNCSECGKEVSSLAPTCPQCGAPLRELAQQAAERVRVQAEKARVEKAYKTNKKILYWIGGIVLAFYLLFQFADNSLESDAIALGFASAKDQADAKAKGITDPAKFAEVKAKEKADKALADAENKRIADEKAAADALILANCPQELSCLAPKHKIAASVYCEKEIERRAKFQVEWDTGWLKQTFSAYKWKSKKNGVISYVGDSVKFQNGFGAWQNMIYSCDFDTATEQVLAVKLSPGKLN